MGGQNIPRVTSDDTPPPGQDQSVGDAGTGYDVDDNPWFSVNWGGRQYTVDEVYAGSDGKMGLPAGATVVGFQHGDGNTASGSGPGENIALIDRTGDGVPDLVARWVSKDQFEQWRTAGLLPPGMDTGDLGAGYDGAGSGAPGALPTTYSSGDTPAQPRITGSRGGGTFGTGAVEVEPEAMTAFIAAVRAAGKRFSGTITDADLRAVDVQPGWTPNAEKLRGLLNGPGSTITGWLQPAVHDTPSNIDAMATGLEDATNRYTQTTSTMKLDARTLTRAMDAGAGAGSATDIDYDDI